MTRPQTANAIVVAITAYRQACEKLGAAKTPRGRDECWLCAQKAGHGECIRHPDLWAPAEAMRLKAEANLLRATLAYGRRCTEDPLEMKP